MASQLKLATLLALSLLASVCVASPLPIDASNFNANELPGGGASDSGPHVYHNIAGFPPALPAPIPHAPRGLHTPINDRTAGVNVPLDSSVGQYSHPNTKRKEDKTWGLHLHPRNVDPIPVNYNDIRDVQDDTALYKHLNNDVDGSRGEGHRDRSGPS